MIYSRSIENFKIRVSTFLGHVNDNTIQGQVRVSIVRQPMDRFVCIYRGVDNGGMGGGGREVWGPPHFSPDHKYYNYVFIAFQEIYIYTNNSTWFRDTNLSYLSSDNSDMSQQ